MKKIILAAVVLSQLAWGAVAIDARATGTNSANATTGLLLTTLTVGAGSNRAMVVQLVFSADPGATVTAQWDDGASNQAVTSIGTANNTVYTKLFGIVAPISGNKTLRMEWTNAVDAIVFAVAFTGVDQTGGATSFPNFTSATGSGANPSFSITSAAGDWTISTLACATANPSAPNQTQDFINTAQDNVNGAGEDATGSASVTHSWTAAANAWAMAGVSVKASGGAAAVSMGRRVIKF